MIDKITISNLGKWPEEAIDQLEVEILNQLNNKEGMLERGGGEISITIPEGWAKLPRERLKHEIVDTLDKANVDHGLSADVQTIENVEVPDEGFRRASEEDE